MVHMMPPYFCFQAEDGIRYYKVTGVQTCALPISISSAPLATPAKEPAKPILSDTGGKVPHFRQLSVASCAFISLCVKDIKIGRASCRERVYILAAAV